MIVEVNARRWLHYGNRARAPSYNDAPQLCLNMIEMWPAAVEDPAAPAAVNAAEARVDIDVADVVGDYVAGVVGEGGVGVVVVRVPLPVPCASGCRFLALLTSARWRQRRTIVQMTSALLVINAYFRYSGVSASA